MLNKSKNQIRFQTNLENAGGQHILVESLDDSIKILEEG